MYILVSLCFIAGCTSKDYKAEADAQVYRIIDQKWQDEFGSRANYKISDVAPLPNDIQINKEISAGEGLDLSRAVAIATAHNRDYQTQKELLYTSALDLRLVRHLFETQYMGGLSGGYGADRNDELTGVEANLGFNRLLSYGTIISAKISAAYVDVLTGNMRSGLTSILSAAVTQPFLRGSDPNIVLEPLVQADRDTLYQIRNFSRFRQLFVVSVITQYYQVIKLHDIVKTTEANYDTLTQLARRIEKLKDAGRLPAYELDRIKQEMLQVQDVLVQAQKEYELSLDQFKITLGLPTTSEFRLDENELDTLRAIDTLDTDFDEGESIHTALSRRLDLINYADRVIDARRKVVVAADALRAELNLTGSADVVAGDRGNRRNVQFTEDYLLDINLDLPLDRVAEQNVYRKALITLNQSRREYELASDTVAMEVRQALRDLKKAAERYKLQKEGFQLAQERYRKTYTLMQYSRASSRRVLSAQSDMIDAQNEATDALVNYTIAMLNFYRDTGVLQVRPDGMWEKGMEKEILVSE
ncbi:MAG: TolC family protein [Sedimentisphaerales bacterium]|nr:TolC family protein [Sedimentisphaerales bacterium]